MRCSAIIGESKGIYRHADSFDSTSQKQDCWPTKAGHGVTPSLFTCCCRIEGCLVSDVTDQTMPSSITGGRNAETDRSIRADILRLAKGFSWRHRWLRIRRIMKFGLGHPKAIARPLSDLEYSADRRQTLGTDLYYLNCLLRNFIDHNTNGPRCV